jgi:hypothetical protein
MSDANEFHRRMLAAKEFAKVVAQSNDPAGPEAKSARGAYRRALEAARDAAPNDSTREMLDDLLNTDPKAAE